MSRLAVIFVTSRPPIPQGVLFFASLSCLSDFAPLFRSAVSIVIVISLLQILLFAVFIPDILFFGFFISIHMLNVALGCHGRSLSALVLHLELIGYRAVASNEPVRFEGCVELNRCREVAA